MVRILTKTSGFPNACYKSFKTETEALEYISSHVSSSIAKKRASSEVQGTSAANKRCQKFDTTLNIGIMFDGGSRGNPGLAGAGAVVTITKIETEEDGVKRSSHKAIYYIRKYLGAMLTNNIAEYEGLLIGLRKACEEAKKYRTTPLSLIHTNLVVQGDSKLIINQLNGEFQCKNILLKPKHREAVELLEALERLGACKKALEHIYRKDNNVADRKYRFICLIFQ